MNELFLIEQAVIIAGISGCLPFIIYLAFFTEEDGSGMGIFGGLLVQGLRKLKVGKKSINYNSGGLGKL